MNIEQIVQQAIEEFGELAHERFTDDKGLGFADNDELNRELVGWCDIQLKPLPDLFAHDIKTYRDNAYQMWEWDLKDIQVHDFYNNCEIVSMLSLPDFTVMRKQSASIMESSPFRIITTPKAET
jgi:hypothetical protein